MLRGKPAFLPLSITSSPPFPPSSLFPPTPHNPSRTVTARPRGNIALLIPTATHCVSRGTIRRCTCRRAGVTHPHVHVVLAAAVALCPERAEPQPPHSLPGQSTVLAALGRRRVRRRSDEHEENDRKVADDGGHPFTHSQSLSIQWLPQKTLASCHPHFPPTSAVPDAGQTVDPLAVLILAPSSLLV